MHRHDFDPTHSAYCVYHKIRTHVVLANVSCMTNFPIAGPPVKKIKSKRSFSNRADPGPSVTITGKASLSRYLAKSLAINAPDATDTSDGLITH